MSNSSPEFYPGPISEVRGVVRDWEPRDRRALRSLLLCLGVVAVASVGCPVALRQMTSDPFWAGLGGSGVIFSVGFIWTAVVSRDVSPAMIAVVTLVALAFPLWGFWIGAILLPAGGAFGVPQAFLTGALLVVITRSWLPGFGSVAGVGFGWMAAQFMDGPTGRLLVLVGAWNVLTVAAMAFWSLGAQRRWRHEVERGYCTACGYDLKGLTRGVCPECGRSLPTAG